MKKNLMLATSHKKIYCNLKYLGICMGFLGAGMLSGHLFYKKENGVLESKCSSNTVEKGCSVQKSSTPTKIKIISKDFTRNELGVILDRLLQGEVPKDWVLELKKISDLSGYNSSPQRSKNLLILFSKWADKDFESAMNTAGTLGPDAFEITKELLSQFAKKDPALAFEYYSRNKEKLIKHQNFLKDIAYFWGKQSPETAFEWCSSFNNEIIDNEVFFRKSEAMKEFMCGVFDLNNSALTMKYIQEIQKNGENINLDIIQEWGKRNPKEVVQWMIDSNIKTNSTEMVSAIQGIAEKDLKMAEELLVNFSPSQQQGIVSIIARNTLMKNKSAEYALEWTVSKIPLSELKDYALSPSRDWCLVDPNGAETWIEKQSDSSGKDLAIDIYIETLSNEFERMPDMYPKALKLVQSINDPKKKESLSKKLNKEWEKSAQLSKKK